MKVKAKIPKDIVEFGNILEYPFLYGQLISMTVSIYKSKLSALEKNKRKSIPRHPRTLIREAFVTSKNRLGYNDKFLLDSGIPSLLGIQRSKAIVARDFGINETERKKAVKNPLQKKTFLGPVLYGVAIGDYVDCRFEKIIESRKKGSANTHKCLDRSKLKSELKSLRDAMDIVFSCDTAFGDCNNNSMASGHCMLASLIIQDMYGGEIKAGTINGIPHYWNSVCGLEVDLTGDQFKKPTIQIKKGNLYPSGNPYKFGRDPFETMNQDFNREVWTKHCKFRKRVQKELQKKNKSLSRKLEKSTNRLS